MLSAVASIRHLPPPPYLWARQLYDRGHAR
jgi:hypothetical protein